MQAHGMWQPHFISFVAKFQMQMGVVTLCITQIYLT